MKLATYLMTFGADTKIVKSIQNVFQHVEKIYVLHSTTPFTYNPNAYKVYTNTFNLNLLQEHPFTEKLTIIQGNWATEEDAREAAKQRAIEDQCTHLMMHDPDEFYTYDDMLKIKWILEYDFHYTNYTIFTRTFWKSFSNIIHMPALSNAPSMTNTELSNKIINLVEPNLGNALLNDIICYHASFVLSDEEAYQKLKTWRYFGKFDEEKWYNEVWLPGSIESTNFHPVEPEKWTHCENYTGPLPETILNW